MIELHIRTSPQCDIMLVQVAACIPYVIRVGAAKLTYFDVTFTENHNVYRQSLPLFSIYDFYTSAYCPISCDMGANTFVYHEQKETSV